MAFLWRLFDTEVYSVLNGDAHSNISLTTVHQHVPVQTPLVSGDVAALRTPVDLLVGVQMSHVLLELHGVKGDEGAELTAELLLARVALAPVLQEQALVGAGEVALRAVVGHVRPPVLLHVPLVGKDGVAGVMATLHRCDAVGLPGVTQQLFA